MNPPLLCCLLLCALACSGASAQNASAPKQHKQQEQKQQKRQPPQRNQQQQRAAAPSASPAERQRSLQDEREELTRNLARLKQQLASAQASRKDAADALASSERAISTATRRLGDLATERQQIEAQLTALRERQHTVSAAHKLASERMALLTQQQYLLAREETQRDWIAGRSTGQPARDGEYLGYLARATAQSVRELEARSAELVDLEDQSRKKRDLLAGVEAQEGETRQRLLQEKAERQRALDRLARQIDQQRQSVDKLERDDRRLTQLISDLSKVLAEQARRDAERSRRAAAPARPAPSGTAQAPRAAAAAPAPPTAAPLPPASGEFAARRGSLPMPVTGTVIASFGSPRPIDGAGAAPTWKGVLIRAPQGAPVKAVAPGQVVFADWLRGFGNLMVIDHGDGYLSIYGNNETLLRNIGDRVAVGDTVASVGSTGGSPESGLYFELRFNGRPFDPLTWVAAR